MVHLTRYDTLGVNPTHFFLLHQSTCLTLYFISPEETMCSMFNGKKLHLGNICLHPAKKCILYILMKLGFTNCVYYMYFKYTMYTLYVCTFVLLYLLCTYLFTYKSTCLCMHLLTYFYRKSTPQ